MIETIIQLDMRWHKLTKKKQTNQFGKLGNDQKD